tara:strand:- start:13 stop:225 length:213 start_codon:yes stop_codon:yes gene_type:complete
MNLEVTVKLGTMTKRPEDSMMVGKIEIPEEELLEKIEEGVKCKIISSKILEEGYCDRSDHEGTVIIRLIS